MALTLDGTAGITANPGTVTVTSGTVTTSTPIQNDTQTWNASGVTFTGWKVNITDTASASGSLLADLQVGGSSKFSVRKDGAALASDGTVGSPGITFASDTDTGLYRIGANNIGIGVNGAKVQDISTTGTAVTGRVSYSASALGTYQWDSFNPTNVSGTSTNAPSTGTTVDTEYITLANSSGTVTCTFDIAGRYLIACNGQAAHSSTYVYDRITWTLGGTATRYVVGNPSNSGDSANDLNMAIAVVFSVTATAAQTLTVLPSYEVSGGGTTANHQCSPQLYVTYLGG